MALTIPDYITNAGGLVAVLKILAQDQEDMCHSGNAEIIRLAAARITELESERDAYAKALDSAHACFDRLATKAEARLTVLEAAMLVKEQEHAEK